MNSVPSGVQDLLESFRLWRIFTLLGWQRIKGNYKRTVLGDFWVTLNKTVHIVTIGVVFAYVFQSPRADYIPHLALGTIIWAVIAGDLNTACRIFVMNAGTIKQVPLPLHLHLLQLYWQNLILLGHNLLILPGIWWYSGLRPEWSMGTAVLGLLVLQLNLGWLGLLLAIVCARFRDLEQIIANLLQISYFLTPIMWLPDRVLGRAKLEVSWLHWNGLNWGWEQHQLELLHFNPFYHLLELVRAPLLLQPVASLHWWVAGGFATVGWLIAIYVFQRTRSRIIYWL